ncbi:MAG: hypothetical protein QOC75_425, partial [Pseudonocardiales bacterium]|nr:hypothetical protein [Pseudonocardiales bacterium]
RPLPFRVRQQLAKPHVNTEQFVVGAGIHQR